MRIRFDGKTVAVSGAGHGFGRCIAETFAQRGARVFGCDLSAAELAETATAGVEAEVVDLSDRVAAAAWIARIEQTTGGAVDVLVNNAGGVAEQEMHPIEKVPDADWDRVFAVNIGAAFALSRASRKSGSQQTPCWREQDSNHRSRVKSRSETEPTHEASGPSPAEPMVRILFPPAVSLQTFGPSPKQGVGALRFLALHPSLRLARTTG